MFINLQQKKRKSRNMVVNAGGLPSQSYQLAS